MRCRPGDLALIVRASRYPELLGLPCTVIGPASSSLRDWAVEIPNHPCPQGGYWDCWDNSLFPIKPHGGHDETLQWKRVGDETPADIIRELTE